MSLAAILHLVLHIVVPLLLALVVDRKRWWRLWLVMMLTMAVDLDHLLAVPLYDPDRCSIVAHPLHRWFVWPLYGLLALLPPTRWWGVGLLIHMALDASDCVRQQGYLPL